MKTIIKAAALTALLSITTVYAGGKMVAPAVSPVALMNEPVEPNPFYIGIGILWAGVSRDCITQDCPNIRLKESEWGGIIRGGYDFNQYIGIEGRALKATLDSDWAKTTHYGIFLKPFMPVGERTNVYALLGYGHTEIDVDCFIQEKYKANGFSWGIGLEYDLSSKEDDYENHKRSENDVPEFDRPFDGQGDQETRWGLWVDYQNLLNNKGPDNYKTNIITFGITYDF